VNVGITGHQRLTTATQRAVGREIAEDLRHLDGPLIGVTSLAAGADQLFANLILKAGGRLAVIVPSRDYTTTFTEQTDRAAFDSFCAAAEEVTWLPFDHASEEAFWAAGQQVVDRSDLLFAVWDGEGAGGRGGTADVVTYARRQGKPVRVIWPAGASRT
jgi:hypothetical protein